MDAFGLRDWQNWLGKGYTRLPFVRLCPNAQRPATWRAFADSAAFVLLESAQSGRFTYVCQQAKHVVIGSPDHGAIWTADLSRKLRTIIGDPLAVLRALLDEAKVPPLPDSLPMMGGLMGALGYDVVHTWEKLPTIAKRESTVPLYAMVEANELFVYDELEHVLRIVVWADVNGDPSSLAALFQSAATAAAGAEQQWLNLVVPTGPPTSRAHLADGATDQKLAASFSAADFETAVRRVLEYIAAGDTYQVNLSLRTSRRTTVSPHAIYEALRVINPSPYMGLLRLPSFALVCGSPELLVRLVDGVVSSRPIAGTRPRGVREAQDSHFSAELFASEKERAEHLMLVDLIRNDIGRVAQFGSVEVKEFMVLERYSHVMHIVSQVEGRLGAGRTWVDVFQAMFPGGTITGCPKFRTMEIIEELEPVSRDFYTGALGWISYAGEMEMNIVIRSMLLQGGIAQVQSGAGIVADSRPDRELDEALRKAQALWVALDQATASHG